MGFYVVQTRKTKKSKPNLTVVPSTWVKNNIVYWPPNNLTSLAKDKDSMPDAKAWKQQKCKVVGKASTFDKAEDTMQKLEMLTDSEDAVDMPRGTRLHPAKKKPKFVSKAYQLALPTSKTASQVSNNQTVSVGKASPEMHDTYDASNGNQHEMPSGSFGNNPLLSGLATDSKTPNPVNTGIASPAAPVSAYKLKTVQNAPQHTVPEYHPPIQKPVVPAENTKCFAHPSAVLRGTNQINVPTVSIPPQFGHFQELPPRFSVPSTSKNTANVTGVPFLKSTTDVSLQQHVLEKPVELPGPKHCSAESPSESYQGNQSMFTIVSATDDRDRQYLQLENGSLVEITVQNADNVIVPVHPVDASVNMDIHSSESPFLMTTTNFDAAGSGSANHTNATDSHCDNPTNGSESEVSKKLDSILSRLGKMETAVEKIMVFMADTQRFMRMRSDDPESVQTENTRKRKMNENYSEFESLFPVPGEQQLLLLENSLKNQAVNDKFFDYFEFSFNLNGKRNSGSFFKVLLRKVLVPTILVPYSWKGQSRNTPGTERMDNKSFKDTFPTFVNFILRVVRAADYEFTQEQCYNAFSLYLRNKNTEIKRFTGEGNQREAHSRRRKRVETVDNGSTTSEALATVSEPRSEHSLVSSSESDLSVSENVSNPGTPDPEATESP